jgi:hypothetical protein
MFRVPTVNLSIVGLIPALRRLKVVQLNNYTALSSHQNGELLGIAADCDTLEEFGYSLTNCLPRDDFKAICQLWSRFLSLKRVIQDEDYISEIFKEVRLGYFSDTRAFLPCRIVLRFDFRFVAFPVMIKTSKTIEQVPPFQCHTAEEEAAITQHLPNNMIQNFIECIRKKGLLTVPLGR